MVELNEGQTIALFKRSVLYFRLNKTSQALDDINKYLKFSPYD
ncbi:MAG: hypothetical protein V2I33_23300 [Kangiellaceae bacterium]|nr:hypothetical protein [Kangiellaceae bacterium]